VDQGWEDRAQDWIAWARRPNFDGYWSYRDAFLDEVLPPAGRATLEIGCGEGRVARDLAARGHRVTAIDASPSLVRAATAADPESTYRVANAEALPFSDAAFDAVVAYNSLIDVQDLGTAVHEAARVLAPGGSMGVCVTHPVRDAGSYVDDSPGAAFVIEGSYRGGRPSFDRVFEREGLTMNFRGGHSYDLETYSRAFETAGLLVRRIREPAPSSIDRPGAPGLFRGRRIPVFLMMRLVKP